jgi:hypothetical protein
VNVHPQIDHREPVAVQQQDQVVLADVVDVPLHGSQQDQPGVVSVVRLLDDRLDEFEHLAENLPRHDQPGEIILMLLVAQPNQPQPLLAVLDDLQRIVPVVQTFLHQSQRFLLFEVGDVFNQRLLSFCLTVHLPSWTRSSRPICVVKLS